MRSLSTAILLIVLGLIVPISCVVMNIQFNQNCAGYLKQAADANTVELAKERIDLAVDYIEMNALVYGYTSVLWKTESENVEYWYKNIKACQRELEQCKNASQLEKSNVLLKVRESLTDNGKDGTELILPYGISRYPNNVLLGIMRAFSYILILLGCFVFYNWMEEY